MTIPHTTAVGDAIAYVREQMQTEEGMSKKYTFSGSIYFERMKELGSYTTDIAAIQKRVEEAGFKNFFDREIR